MVYSKVAKFDTLRSLANGSISASYAAVGGAVSNAVRAFRLINNTDGDMFFSLDGVNNQMFVPKTSYVLWDLSSNAISPSSSAPFVVVKGSIFYVKQSTAPTTGSVFIEIIYAQGE